MGETLRQKGVDAMRIKQLFGLVVDDRGEEFLVPVKLSGIKKLNSKTIEVSALLKIIDGVKAWSKKAAK